MRDRDGEIPQKYKMQANAKIPSSTLSTLSLQQSKRKSFSLGRQFYLNDGFSFILTNENHFPIFSESFTPTANASLNLGEKIPTDFVVMKT